MKRITYVFLSVIILFGILTAGFSGFDRVFGTFSITASAEDTLSGTFSDGLTWNYDEATKTLTVGGAGKMNGAVPWKSESYCSEIKTVIINPGVTSIGDSAFYNCTGLENITIPDSVTSIGDSAFYNCTGLANITIPDSVTSIGDSAFYNCTGLENITIPDSVTSIGSDSFTHTGVYNNPANWEDGVLYIGKYLVDSKWNEVSGDYSVREGTLCIAAGAFCPFFGDIYDPEAYLNYTGITSLTIPESVKSIGSIAFVCKDLKTVYFNAADCNLEACQNGFGSEYFIAPFFLSAVETVYIGDRVERLPSMLFYDCPFLEKIYFPDSAISIVDPVFGLSSGDVYLFMVENWNRLYGLMSIPYTDVCLYVHDASYAYTFALANGIEYALYDDEGSAFTVKNGVLTGYEGETENIVLPSGVSVIGSGAFKGNTSFKNVEIPYGVSLIGDEAFSGCTSLESVTIPFTVTKIGKNVFDGTGTSINCFYNSYACKYADGNNIPRNLITVDFARDSITMGVSQTASLGVTPSVPVASGLPLVFTSSDPDVASVDSEGNVTAVSAGEAKIYVYTEAGNYLGKCTVKAADNHCGDNLIWNFDENTRTLSITGTGDMYDYNATGNVPWKEFKGKIENVTIGYGVTGIGNFAFAGCFGLKETVIPGSVTRIGDWAFQSCSALETLSLSEGVAVIGKYAFADCDLLGSISLPDTLVSIDTCAFFNCKKLETISIPENVASIGVGAFSACNGLESISVDPDNRAYSASGNCLINSESKVLEAGCKNSVIPADGSVTAIGDRAFESCIGLESLTIPESITSVGIAAFLACSSLKNVEISDGVKEIGDNAFQWCSSLESVSIPSSIVSVGDSAFFACDNLDTVYYGGTAADKGALDIGDQNDSLNNAEWIYHSHTFTSEITKEATCKEEGSITYTCSDCGFSYTETVSRTENHSWDTVIINPDCTHEGRELSVCRICGNSKLENEIPALGHSFTNYKYNNDATTEKDGTETAKCDRCDVKNTRTAAGTRLNPDTPPVNPTAGARLNVKASQTVDYRSNVTVTATATGVPEGYYLAIYDGAALKSKGSNTKVIFKAGEMTSGKSFTVKVIDSNKTVQKDSSGAELAANCEVKVKTGFFDKIIAFFRGLFGLLPSVEVKP